MAWYKNESQILTRSSISGVQIILVLQANLFSSNNPMFFENPYIWG